MDLTKLSSQLKINTDFNASSTFGLRDINSVTGIIDNSVSSLQALIFSNEGGIEKRYINPFTADQTEITSGYSDKAFIFDIKKEYKYNLASDITDHYVEDNEATQDQIALRPRILEVTGCIGEITLLEIQYEYEDNQSKSKQNAFNAVDSFIGRMGSLTSFAPNIVNQALDTYNSAKFVYATANKFVNYVKKDLKGKSTEDYRNINDYTESYDLDVIKKSRQFEWIDWFTTQWKNRASFTIITPYGEFKNMYIMDLSASQPENSRYYTNLNIKFKEIRQADIIDKPNKEVSQPMKTQRDKNIKVEKNKKDETFDVGELDISKTDYIKIQNALAQPPSNPGSVTQVTQLEYNTYIENLPTLNVAPLSPQKGVAIPENISMMGGVTFNPLPPIMGGAK